MASTMPPPLPPLVPPLRFGMVEEGVYRGAYPSRINLRFLDRLRLRTLVCLLPEPPTEELSEWCTQHDVFCAQELVPISKDEVVLTNERVAHLLQLLVTPERQPVLVHCLDGRCVTGALIMCLRKLQRWSLAAAVAEYSRFARSADTPRQPPSHVLQLVESFKPETEFARFLPPRLPCWLALALRLPATAQQEKRDVPAVERVREPPSTTVPANFVLERAWQPSAAKAADSSRAPQTERESESLAVPTADPHARGESLLKALALEGITIKREAQPPRSVQRLTTGPRNDSAQTPARIG